MSGGLVSTFPANWTVADILRQLGDVPANRVCAVPAPGMATEADLDIAESTTGRTYELVDGVLVEKPVGYLESMLALVLARAIGDFVDAGKLGIILGADGPVRILPGQIRVPDVAFISWDRFADRVLPREPVLATVPDLVVEVLSEGNTSGEMARKLEDYFQAGVRLVWYVDPQLRQVDVFRGRNERHTVDESGTLSGVDVLPGFEFPVRTLFAQLPKP